MLRARARGVVRSPGGVRGRIGYGPRRNAMICPRDGETLRPVVSGLNEFVWDCPNCASRAVAMPVLRRHLGEAAADDVWQRAKAADTPIDAPCCPSCSFPMAHVQIAHAGGDAVLEVCGACLLVWYSAPLPGGLLALPPPSTREHENGANGAHGAQGAGAGTSQRTRVRPPPSQPPPVVVPAPQSWWQATPLLTQLFAIAILAVYLAACAGWTGMGPLRAPGQMLMGTWAPWSELDDDWFESLECLMGVGTLFTAIAFSSGVEEWFGKGSWAVLLFSAIAFGACVQEMLGVDSVAAGCGLEAAVSAFAVVCVLRLHGVRLGVWIQASSGRVSRDAPGDESSWWTFASVQGLFVWTALVLVRQVLPEPIGGHWEALLPALAGGAVAGVFAACFFRETE